MALPTLDALTEQLDERTVNLLGDPLTLTPRTGSPVLLMGFIDHGEGVRDFGLSAAQVGERMVMIRKTDRAEIAKDDVFHLPAIGLDFLPREIRNDESGRWWIILLRRKSL